MLVDLAGHTAGNRLLVFARRPAPVQVEYLIGHGYSSGLSAIDAFLADEALAPTGCEHLFSERLVRLPRIPLAYTPSSEMPAVAPPPALANSFVTFGHFGRPVRLNGDVISAWARILHAVPASRLVLNSAPFAEPAGRDLFAKRFAARVSDATGSTWCSPRRKPRPGRRMAASTSRSIRSRTMPAPPRSRRCGRVCRW